MNVKGFSLSAVSTRPNAERCIEAVMARTKELFPGEAHRLPAVRKEEGDCHFTYRSEGDGCDLNFHFCGHYLLLRCTPGAGTNGDLDPGLQGRLQNILSSVFEERPSGGQRHVSFDHLVP